MAFIRIQLDIIFTRVQKFLMCTLGCLEESYIELQCMKSRTEVQHMNFLNIDLDINFRVIQTVLFEVHFDVTVRQICNGRA